MFREELPEKRKNWEKQLIKNNRSKRKYEYIIFSDTKGRSGACG